LILNCEIQWKGRGEGQSNVKKGRTFDGSVTSCGNLACAYVYKYMYVLTVMCNMKNSIACLQQQARLFKPLKMPYLKHVSY